MKQGFFREEIYDIMDKICVQNIRSIHICDDNRKDSGARKCGRITEEKIQFCYFIQRYM